MKVILYIAMSINGYIATTDNKTPWSKKEWESFSAKVKEIKNIVIGRKTYEIMTKQHEFKNLGNPFIVVISNTTINNPNINSVKSPKQAIKLLKEKGFTSVFVGGGSLTNSSFIRHKLINEIYLDIEPFLFGTGIPFLTNIPINLKLQLLSTKLITKNTIQLHYKVNN